MSNNSKKRFWRAEVTFMDSGKDKQSKTSKVLGTKRENCADCIKELEHFLRSYAHNEIVSIGIFKGYE